MAEQGSATGPASAVWPKQYFAKCIYHTTKLYFVLKNRYKTHAVKLTLSLQSMNHQTKPSIKYFNFMARFYCGFDTCLVLKWWMSQLVLLVLKRILFHLFLISLVISEVLFWKTKIVELSFQWSWFVKWPVLHYDEVQECVFCHTCMKAFKERNRWSLRRWIPHL